MPASPKKRSGKQTFSPDKIRRTLDLPESMIAEKYPDAFALLLADKTAGKNIVWATADYENLSEETELKLYPRAETDALVREDILQNFIRPRCAKEFALRRTRTRERAEVFTPPRICNAQNNLFDEIWFGRKNVFNQASKVSSSNALGWRSQKRKITFPPRGKKTWRKYVALTRMEIACGEAPYLVSRYDSTRGKMIPLDRRIGILDRKLRVVSENCPTQKEFFELAKIAFQSCYGFELQGDNLLLARENLLFSFYDYFFEKFSAEPSPEQMREIAEIIAWNVFQMDAFTGTPPFAVADSDLLRGNAVFCKIKDWATEEIVEFKKFLKNENVDL